MVSVLERVEEEKKATEAKLVRGGVVRTPFWKPKAGANRLRIMPPWVGPDTEDSSLMQFQGQFWREVAQHWNVTEDQKGPTMCPKMTPGLTGDCPICEYVEELKAQKTNPKAQMTAKALRAKVSFFYNVVDMADQFYTAEDVADWTQSRPDTECPFEAGALKIQIYAAPLTVHDNILGLITSNREDITRLDTGRCISLVKFPSKDPKKTRYQVTPEFKAQDFDLGGTALPPLHNVGYLMTYDDIASLLAEREDDLSLPASTATTTSKKLSAGSAAPSASDAEGSLSDQLMGALKS